MDSTIVDLQINHKPATLEIPGLTRALRSTHNSVATEDGGAKLIIVMVGLPARGKSYIVKKLARYLNWLQYKTQIFNVGERRRRATVHQIIPRSATNTNYSSSSASFFDPNDPDAVKLRDQLALGALDELLEWLIRSDGSIGILDATNSTLVRRQLVLSHIRNKVGRKLGLIYLESCCLDQELLDKNFQLKLSGPDYKGRDPEKALFDFRGRVANYEKTYVSLGKAEEEQKIPYIQMIDAGRRINTHMIRGYLATHVVEYLLNFNLFERQIWISCNGESVDDASGKIGRTSHLTDMGRNYARALSRFIEKQRKNWEQSRKEYPTDSPLEFCIWTSMMPQAIQTALEFPEDHYIKKQMKMLDDLNAGNMAGLTFDEIQTLYPEEFAARKRNKLLHRWPGPGGECYVDVINRLRSVIVELEGMTDHLLLITHRAVVRVIIGYFLGIQRDGLADMIIPKNSVFCLEPVRL